MEKKLNSPLHERTVHDFINENKVVLVLGGFYIYKEPLPYFICNVLYLICMLLMLLFLTAMSFVTLAVISEEKILLEQTVHFVIMLTITIFLPFIKLCRMDSITMAGDILMKGIDQYPDEEFVKEYNQIKNKRVDEIIFINSIIKKLSIFCPFANTFLVPALKFILKTAENNTSVNPYLPMPLYLPFNTWTFFGFVFSFFATGVVVFFGYISGHCLVTTYLSCAYQLIAQIEILNHSLKNIEARAFSKLKKSGFTVQLTSTSNLYIVKEYQQWLDYCLKQNILHHQSILRFKEAVRPFLETVNLFANIVFSIIMASSIILLYEHKNINPGIIGLLVFDMTCYFLLSSVCQIITNKSAETLYLLYSTPWTNCNTNFKVLLKIMVEKTQELIILRASGLSQPASLETFGNMVSVGYRLVNIVLHK